MEKKETNKEMVISVVIAYLILVLIIGYYAKKFVHDEVDFLAAGGKLGPLVGGASLAATQMSAGTAIGSVGFHYLFGYNFAWVWLGIWASWVIMSIYIAPKMKNFFYSHKALTIPDLLGTRFESNGIRILSVIILIVSFGMTIVAELVGGAYILNVIFNTPKNIGIIIIAAILIAYTYLGGLFAVAYTSLVQMIVFAISFVFAIPFVIKSAGGFLALNEKLAAIEPTLVFNGMPLNALIAALISFFIMMIGYPLVAVRFYAIKNTKSIQLAVGYSFIFQGILAFAVAILGVSARVLFPDLATPDLATPTIAMMLPGFFGGLLLAGVLAAIQSTASSTLLMLSSGISHDIVKNVMGRKLSEKEQLRLNRIAVLILGIIPIPFAMFPTPLIQQIWINAACLIGSSFAVVTFLGLYWKRATKLGALASMLGGLLTASIWLILGNPFGIDPVYISLPVSLILMIIISLITKPVSKEALMPFFKDERIENE